MIVNHMVLRGHVTNQICYISTCTRTMDTKQGKVATYCEGLPSINKKKKLKITLWPLFLWMGFNCLKATATSRRKFNFYHSVPRNSWYSFHRPRKDERLSRPWSHPVVSNTGSRDWQSSALTTRPLLHKPLNTWSHEVTWQIKIIKSLLLPCPWSPNLSICRRVKRSVKPGSYMISH